VEPTVTAVGVIDKAARLLAAVEDRPLDLTSLIAVTGLPRATTHRLAVSLESHGLLRRDGEGRFTPGLRLMALGRAAATALHLPDVARPALLVLRDDTGESTQLYVRDGDRRICIVSLESPHGLRTIVPVGASLPLDAGSAGHLLSGARDAVDGWVESVGEREPGVASVSAPVRSADGEVIAAVSVSGPIDRFGAEPGATHGAAVVKAAAGVEAALGGVRAERSAGP